MLACILIVTLTMGCAQDAQPSTDQDGSEPDSAAGSAKTFDLAGTIYVESISNGKVGAECRPDEGEPRPGAEPSGVKIGADVTVANADGKVVGLGHVNVGTYSPSGYSMSSYCEVPFDVVAIPDSGQFFSVQVGSLDPERYTREELRTPVVMDLS